MTISILNSFIIINDARIERYKTASTDAEESFLKKTFINFQKTSQACKSQLTAEIIKLGGTPVIEKNHESFLDMIWLKISKILISKDSQDIIYSCNRNDNIIIQTYYEAIYNNPEYLTNKQKAMLNDQYYLINEDRAMMKSLKKQSTTY